MLAAAIASLLVFAPPDVAPSGPGAEASTETETETPAEIPEPEPPAPAIEPPGSIVLAPAQPGEYRLFDGDGGPVGEPVALGDGKQLEMQLPAGIYYVHGPGAVQPLVVVSGTPLAWDGKRVLPRELWASRQAQEAQARAEAERAAAEAQRAEAERLAAESQPRPDRRAWASPLSSTFIPGLGQIINGQGGKGAGLLFGTIGSIAGAAALYSLENDGTRSPAAEYSRLIGYGVFSTAAPLLWIYAIADAYKVATDKQVRPALEHKVRISATRMMSVGFRADVRRPGFYDDWSISIMGQAARRLTLGISDISVKAGGDAGPQVWQFGARIDYRVLDRKRVWIDLALGSILQVAVGQNPTPLDPELGAPRATTRFGAVPYGQLDVRVFVLDRLSFDLVPRLAVPLTTRYYSLSRALPRYAPQLELGAGISTYF